MISCFRGRLLLFGGLRGKVKLAANSNSDLYCQDGVQFRKERRLLHHRWRGGVQNRLYGSDGADKGVQSLIVRNAVLRSPDEEQHPHQVITENFGHFDTGGDWQEFQCSKLTQ